MSPRTDHRLSHSWLNGLIAASVISVVLVGALGLRLLEDRLVRNAGEHLSMTAADLAAKLDLVLFERYGDIRLLSETAPSLMGDRPRLSAYLAAMKRAYPLYHWLGVSDAGGRIVVSTAERLIGRDLSRSEWFANVSVKTGVRVLDATTDELSQGVDAVGFVAPMAVEQGSLSTEFQGAVATRIGIPALEEIVTRTLRAFRVEAEYVQRIEYQILNRQGDVLIDSGPEQKGRTNLLKMGLPSVTLALSGMPGFIEETHLRRHVPVITGFARLPSRQELSGLQWVVLVRVDRAAVLGPIRSTLGRAGIWIAIVVSPLLLTLVWMTGRLQREQRATAATVQFVQSTLDSLAAHVAIVDARGTILAVNQAWRRFAGENGLNDPAAGVGSNYLEICDRASGPGSEEGATVSRAIRALLRGERMSALVDYPCHGPGVKRWVRLSLSRFQIEDDVRVVVSHQDVTELVERDRRQAAEHAVTRLLLDAVSMEKAVQDILMTICRILDWNIGAWWRPDSSGDALRFAEFWADDPLRYDAFIDRTKASTFPPGIGLPGRIWKSRRVEWIRDVTTDENFPRAPYAARVGLHAACGLPIVINERVHGVMEFFTGELREPDQAIISMLESLAGQLSQFLSRRMAEEDLRRSEARFSSMLAIASDAIVSIDEAQRIILFNHEASRVFGYAQDEIIGQPLATLLPSRFAESHDRQIREFGRQTGQSIAIRKSREVIGLRKNGEEFPAEAGVSRLTIDGVTTYTVILRDISARKEVDNRLRESEERFALAAQATDAGIWDWDLRTDRLYLSPSWKRMLGYQEEEVENRFSSWESLVHPDDKAALVGTLQAYLDAKVPTCRLEHRLRHKDGGYRWILSHGVSLVDETGKPYRIAGTNVDITIRRQHEEELRKRASQQAGIAALGQQALAASDPAVFMDEAVGLIAATLDVPYCKILELCPDGQSLILRAGVGWKEGLVGHAIVGAGPDSQAGYTLQLGEPVIVDDLGTETRFSGPPLLHDHHIVSGASVVIQAQNRPYGVLGIHADQRRVFSNDDVRFLEAAAGMLGMALERLQAKADLRRQKEQAEASAREKARILAGVHAFFISVSGDGTVTEWTGRSESLFGLTANVAIGRPLETLPIGWSWPAIGEAIRKVAATGTVVRLKGVRLDVPGRKERFLDVNISPPSADGGPALIFMGEDVTDRMNMERELAQAQKLESIGHLAAGIAHEINTPTQFVGDNARFLNDSFAQLREIVGRYRGLLAAVRRGPVPDETMHGVEEAEKTADLDYLMEEVPKALAQSIEGIERIARIVRAMKEFAHPDTGEKAVVDLNKSIESTITVARNEWKYVAEMVTDFDPALPPVQCLPGDINQVMLNLIVNAAHAIGDVVQQTGGKGRITVSTKSAGEWAEIRVADTGTGIPERVREKIFDPFFTTKEVGKGTGQGLAIARSVIVEKHGGTLTCESTVGKGTTFVIRLPIGSQPADAEAGRRIPSVTPAASPATGG
jgi:PAS domain S-box-containing protein